MKHYAQTGHKSNTLHKYASVENWSSYVTGEFEGQAKENEWCIFLLGVFNSCQKLSIVSLNKKQYQIDIHILKGNKNGSINVSELKDSPIWYHS